MLSRSASNLFWLSRYVERMDYLARLLDVAQRMSVLTTSSSVEEWRSALIAAGCEESYFALHDTAQEAAVVHYLTRDASNPSSIMSCLMQARNNARAVRSALSIDVWEAINGAYLDARQFTEATYASDNFPVFVDWVKRQALLFNGAYTNTMLRTDSFYFLRLGTFLERADNTARILDVKYHILLPSFEKVGGSIDYYQWAAILRSVSARRSYHVLYKGRVVPWQVAEMLILRPEMPRSLRACYEQVMQNLDILAGRYEGRSGAPHRITGETLARLRYSSIEDIFQTGLHEFLTEIIERTQVIGADIDSFYLS
jgi:uncharacterized alpha-E superfamily protein